VGAIRSESSEHPATGKTKEVGLIGSKAEWRALIVAISRIIKHEKIELLKETRLLVNKDAHLPMPPIRIEPYGWTSPENRGPIFGMAKPFAFREGPQWGVLMPASTLLVIGDPILLRRILCHEFAHCFWWIGRILEAEANGETHIEDPEIGSEETVSRDKDQLANPAHWLGPWDVEHFLQYESASDLPELDEPTERFFQEWVSVGLRVKIPLLGFSAERIVYQTEIAERWRKIKAGINGAVNP
jgi:hypothetical protein